MITNMADHYGGGRVGGGLIKCRVGVINYKKFQWTLIRRKCFRTSSLKIIALFNRNYFARFVKCLRHLRYSKQNYKQKTEFQNVSARVQTYKPSCPFLSESSRQLIKLSCSHQFNLVDNTAGNLSPQKGSSSKWVFKGE